MLTEMPETAIVQSPTPNAELVAIVTGLSIPLAKATDLITAFSPLYDEAGKLCADAAAVVVSDATQLTEMAQARAIRLAMVKVRGTAGRAHQQIKADILTTGRAIDRAKNDLVARLEPIEAQLEASEKFAERAQAARKEALRAERAPQLVPFGVDPILYNLGEMPDAQWEQLLSGARLAHEAAKAAAAKAEAERLAAEEATRAEHARIRAENDRLLAEAHAAKLAAAEQQRKIDAERAVADAAARVEREAAEAQARAIREKAAADVAAANAARERAEREAQRARDEAAEKERVERAAAERKAKAEAAAARKAAAAPDEAKLRAFAAALRAVPQPVGDQFQVARNIVETAAAAIEAMAEEV